MGHERGERGAVRGQPPLCPQVAWMGCFMAETDVLRRCTVMAVNPRVGSPSAPRLSTGFAAAESVQLARGI